MRSSSLQYLFTCQRTTSTPSSKLPLNAGLRASESQRSIGLQIIDPVNTTLDGGSIEVNRDSST